MYQNHFFSLEIKKIFLLFLLFIFSCTDNECIELETKGYPIIEVDAYYISPEFPDIKNLDIGARIFIYYDLVPINLEGYTYLGNGIYSKDNLLIVPDQSTLIENEKNIPVKIIPLFFDKEFTVKVESGFYKEKFVFLNYSSIPDTIKIHVTFY